ncbi:MAG: hypothetical protein UIG59_07085 [Acutalibacteraceae bacterium]|nr:hypothetical protein [Acutalibacteraceae bacterium]
MKATKIILYKILSVFLAVFLAGCSGISGGEKPYVPMTGHEPHVFKFSEGLKDYGNVDIGNCRKMLGDVYTLVIFLDDDTSSWDYETRNNFYNRRFFPSIEFLADQAEWRGIDLNLQSGQYTTKQDGEKPLRYRGTVQTETDKAINNIDILTQTAKTLGFPSVEVMDAMLQHNLGVTQIAYILMLNKSGRAYAVADTTDNDIDSPEFVVAFARNQYGQDDVGSSILHEVLHLFGAADLYDPSGKYPARKALCKKLYPNDIMMKNAYDPESLEIGRLTECLIGWSDYFPPECDVPEWWQ